MKSVTLENVQIEQKMSTIYGNILRIPASLFPKTNLINPGNYKQYRLNVYYDKKEKVYLEGKNIIPVIEKTQKGNGFIKEKNYVLVFVNNENGIYGRYLTIKDFVRLLRADEFFSAYFVDAIPEYAQISLKRYVEEITNGTIKEDAIYYRPVSNNFNGLLDWLEYKDGYKIIMDAFNKPLLFVEIKSSGTYKAITDYISDTFFYVAIGFLVIFSCFFYYNLRTKIAKEIKLSVNIMDNIVKSYDFRAEKQYSNYVEFAKMKSTISDLLQTVSDQIKKEALNESYVKSLMTNIPGAVYRAMCDKNRTITYVTDKFLDITGYMPHEFMRQYNPMSQKLTTAANLDIFQIIHPEDRKRVTDEYQKFLVKKNSFLLEYRIFTNKENHILWIQDSGAYMQDSQSKEEWIDGIFLDVTSTKDMQKKLFESESLAKNMIENMPHAVYVVDAITQKIIYWNQAATKMFGFHVPLLTPITEVPWPQTYKDTEVKINNSIINGEIKDFKETIPVIGSLGERMCERVKKPIADSEGNESQVAMVLTMVEDNHDKILAEAATRIKAITDAPTQLYNKAYFHAKLNEYINGRVTDPEEYKIFTLILCDLDCLKKYNDILGHVVGDNVIAACARIIKDSFREKDIVARIGGDEYGVILKTDKMSIIENVIRRIRIGERNHNKNPQNYPVSISVGYKIYRDGMSAEEIYKEADAELYVDKELHKTTTKPKLEIDIQTIKASGLGSHIKKTSILKI